VSQNNQVRALNRGSHILVATPGRLLDLMNQGHIQLDRLEVFVLDEADRMLDMGFLPDLKRIISHLPDKRQSLFFSATLPSTIVELSQQLVTRPFNVNVTPKSTSLDAIEQRVLFVERKGKQTLLRDILKTDGVERALVFTKTKRTANTLAERLLESGIKATAIHGNKSQHARQRALESFRRKQVQVLVATDVAARGIDIDGITHVVNFDLPVEPESYVHRIGRTGRAGAEGVALSFCTGSEHGEWRAIEKLIGKKVPLAADQPQMDQPQPNSRGRQENGAKRRIPNGSRSQGSVNRCSSDASGKEGQSKQKRSRRRRRHATPHVKQTS
jgi:ATP-dependent RNA helicase RhlE